jgi:hypothetical protein
MNILDIGSGTEERIKLYHKIDDVVDTIYSLDKKYGFDLDTNTFPQGNWDLLFANHIIEHVHDVDRFIKSCVSVMRKNTVLEIGTPNMCAWFNRILFLFGYLPHSYELSSVFNVGKIKKWKYEELGGHIKVFTPKALCELLELYDLKVISCVGESSTYSKNPILKFIDGLLTKNVNLASAFRVKCTLQS